MSQRRGLGKGLGALIPPGGVKLSTGRGSERSEAPAATRTVPDPAQQNGRQSTTNNSVEPPGEDGPQPPAESVVDITDRPAEKAQDLSNPSNRDALPQQDQSPQPEESTAPAGGEFGLIYAELRIDRIRANAQQPRSVFDEDTLQELADSIREIGLLQPVVVRPDGDGYELVAGERRLRAAQLVGLELIPALVRETDDEAMLRDALLENLHRVQLNPLEEAAAYSQLLADFSCTQEELAGRIGRSRPQISNTLRLLRLPPKVQRRLAAGVLSSGHARALLSFEDESRMEEVAARIVAEGLSVRAVEELALMGSQPGKPRRSRKKRNTPVEYLEAADKLGELLETRVRIEAGAKHGRVVVEFGDVEDLGRILDLIQTGLDV